jgi:large subunit ribosomal protein L29
VKASDLRQLTPEELDLRLRELQNTLFDAKIKHATGQLANSAKLRTTRRDLARALTVSSERGRKG